MNHLAQIRLPRGTEKNLSKKIFKRAGRAMSDFNMIEAGDRLMVCLSGGKDSYALLDVLLRTQTRAPIDFEIIAVNVDQGWPGYDTGTIERHIVSRNVEYRMVDKSFAAIVENNIAPGQTPCSLCSRLRRGVLYNLAVDLECTKIALGHHRDDLIETLLLNVFYSGKISSMPPVLHSDDGRNTVIRPLAYVPEEWIADWAEKQAYPVVNCGCPSCGLPEQKRQETKRLLTKLELENPGLKDQMLAALGNVKTSHLLDTRLLS